MQNKKEGKKKVKGLAIAQTMLLVLGIIAIGYAIGLSVKVVSAQGPVQRPEFQPSWPGISDDPSVESESTDATGATTKAGTTSMPVASGLFAGFKVPEFGSSFGGKDQRWWEDPFNRIKGNLKGTEYKPPIDEAGNTFWQGAKGFAQGFGKDLIAAGAIYGAGELLSNVFKKADTKEAISLAAKAAAIGYMAGKTLYRILDIAAKGKEAVLLGSAAPWIAVGVGVAVAVLIFLSNFKKESIQTIHFKCDVWDAPAKGEYCERCNEQGIIPCTEYQCKSLGQACEIDNADTGEEMCVWKSRNDITPPIIQPWEDILLEDFKYSPDNSIAPPDRGAFIKYKGKCVPAFTPFTFGIISNEPAKCKWDLERKTNFNEMRDFMGSSSTTKYNHSMLITLPSPEALEAENITLENGGNFEVYVRCKDVNDNPKPDSPSASFVFKYCVEEGPDTSPPKILGTNPLSETFISHNQTSIEMELYTNEPAECKWTHDQDRAFDNMEGTMTCSNSMFEMNAQMIYKCTTTLTGLKIKQENKFYFRCKDKPFQTQDRYENQEGYLFVLKGTEPLVIENYGPEGTIKGSSEIVEVTLKAETAAGADEGDATCYYSQSCYEKDGSKESFTSFYYETSISSYTHSQKIWVEKGRYECVIKCNDFGGNLDKKEFAYEIEVDISIPKVVRAFHEQGHLKVITDEEGTCVYSNNDCNYLFEDGLFMDTIDGFEHFADWDADKTFYIRCQDIYGNSGAYGTCSIVVKPFNTFTG